MRRFLLFLAAPLLAQQIPLEGLKPLFDYDASRPLDARTTVIRQEPGAKISQLSYVSPMGGSVDARAGAVSVLIDYPWTRPAEFRHVFRYEDPQKDLDTARQAVVDLRAIDYLAARPDVDFSRIAYIGHSYGAQWGAILSAVDKRMKTCVRWGGNTTPRNVMLISTSTRSSTGFVTLPMRRRSPSVSSSPALIDTSTTARAGWKHISACGERRLPSGGR